MFIDTAKSISEVIRRARDQAREVSKVTNGSIKQESKIDESISVRIEDGGSGEQEARDTRASRIEKVSEVKDCFSEQRFPIAQAMRLIEDQQAISKELWIREESAF